ncbi:signal recognition particle-docking protein FtsY [Henriciella algicola]|uniref:Signal recognition particle receptor FtsY n=1 Tax=Henriciella algicola TaxID=1608422 RepID=A0A399RJL5_9PROT|nr:signal recognition particle-docking protein FtsY [Henriciella algicola]RIJ31856.1 signal recognition particle-docking protein FtsY [Henriciella algicola]
MILWFGKKNKKVELEDAGAQMREPELSAEELAAKEAAEKAEAERKAAEEAAEAERKAAEQAKIDAAIAEANKAWEERQKREAVEAEDEAARQKAENELKILEERRRAEAAREEARRKEEERQAAIARGEPDPYAEIRDPGFFDKLSGGLSKSSSKLGTGLTGMFGGRKLDDDALEDLEDLLIMSDMGAKVSAKITSNLAKTRFDKDISDDEIRIALASEIEAIMKPREQVVDFADGPRPRVVLFVGVNGSGKTTTIGKIASKLKEQGAKALLVAGDTFRAAAIEQLTVWGERAGIPVLSKPTGADAAGLVYEAIEKAQREDLDLVLVDTAGRLQNKAELMSELAKIVRVTRKLDPDAPHDVILVLDATVGQNALSQVEAFRHTAEVSGIVMTKLDGTAKGGVLVAVAEAHALPIHFVGVGEKAEDLQPFSAEAYAKALVGLGQEETV